MTPAAPCPVPRDLSLAALRMEAGAVASLLERLRPDDLSRTTRRNGINVQVLVAHLVRSVDRITTYLAAPVPPSADVDWIGYWGRHGGAEAVAPASIAKRLNDRPIPRVWEQTWRTAVTEVELEASDRLVHTPFGDLALDHYLTTRVVEVTLLGLDLRAALDLEEVATPFAVEVTAAVLDAMLDAPRPHGLDEDLAFVLAATGRRDHDDPSLPILG